MAPRAATTGRGGDATGAAEPRGAASRRGRTRPAMRPAPPARRRDEIVPVGDAAPLRAAMAAVDALEFDDREARCSRRSASTGRCATTPRFATARPSASSSTFSRRCADDHARWPSLGAPPPGNRPALMRTRVSGLTLLAPTPATVPFYEALGFRLLRYPRPRVPICPYRVPGMSTQVVVARISGLAGRAGELRALLAERAAEVRAEPGCIGSEVGAVLDEPAEFLVIQTWRRPRRCARTTAATPMGTTSSRSASCSRARRRWSMYEVATRPPAASTSPTTLGASASRAPLPPANVNGGSKGGGSTQNAITRDAMHTLSGVWRFPVAYRTVRLIRIP
jgi:hypothetical protein